MWVAIRRRWRRLRRTCRTTAAAATSSTTTAVPTTTAAILPLAASLLSTLLADDDTEMTYAPVTHTVAVSVIVAALNESAGWQGTAAACSNRKRDGGKASADESLKECILTTSGFPPDTPATAAAGSCTVMNAPAVKRHGGLSQVGPLKVRENGMQESASTPAGHAKPGADGWLDANSSR